MQSYIYPVISYPLYFHSPNIFFLLETLAVVYLRVPSAFISAWSFSRTLYIIFGKGYGTGLITEQTKPTYKLFT